MKKMIVRKRSIRQGSSTILVILITLTLLMFGVMSMMSVYTSYKISKKSLEWTQENYLLESKAHIFLNELTKIIEKEKRAKTLSASSLEKALKSYEKGTDREITIDPVSMQDQEKKKDIQLEMYFFEDERRKLYVSVRIPKKNKDKLYEILSWKMINPEFMYDTVMYSEGLVEVE